METKKILTADLLDIIFDTRNKSYGAYQLRKDYDNRMTIAFSSMIGLVIVISLFSFIGHPVAKSITLPQTILDPTLVKPPVREEKQIIKPVAHAAVHTITATHPPIIVKNFVEVKPNINMPDTDPTGVVGTSNLPGAPSGPPSVDSSKITATIPAKPEPIKPAGPIDDPDVMPQFPGGTGALIKFLQNNLKSPEDMEENDSKDVRIRFVVDLNGNLSAFDVIRSGGLPYDKEVIRVLKKMPKWNPGKSNNQNVSVFFTLPVKFTSTL